MRGYANPIRVSSGQRKMSYLSSDGAASIGFPRLLGLFFRGQSRPQPGKAERMATTTSNLPSGKSV